MKHIVVDLEMNNIRQKSVARRICTNETIEIGAVMLDDGLQEISSFRTYVKPEYNDGIVPKISRLTGITDAMVANAPSSLGNMIDLSMFSIAQSEKTEYDQYFI